MTELPVQTREVTVVAGTGLRRVSVVIWFVTVAGAIYVRSYLGDQGIWYQSALDDPAISLVSGTQSWEFDAAPVTDAGELDAVSHAYREKYADMGRWLDAMVAPDVVRTTLRLDPRP